MDGIAKILADAEALLKQVDESLKELPTDIAKRLGKLHSALVKKQVLTLQTIMDICAVLEVRPGERAYAGIDQAYWIRESTWGGVSSDGKHVIIVRVSSDEKKPENWTAEECVASGLYSNICDAFLRDLEKDIAVLIEGLDEAKDHGQRLSVLKDITAVPNS